ncbi:transposase [Streptomyces sp. NL15-2K]|uniref:transposase n=1 Tax=Streptomyces sp. NL15-2K TaxID=376149 RepID=UPI001C0E9422|nr:MULTISPECIES: transposase [Actinomycetes]WKX05973.1 hypothetical protein Q4V64_00070 [Kutzneria buriramensis]WKX15971.1 hypothetical protein Q4V64_54240 [Kutzneria buriramensis]WKX16446.1 hypothetical protein Q4V64_54380 [Kutzneria buriramensis]
MRARYRWEGVWGLVDHRAIRPRSVLGRADERVVAALREVLEAGRERTYAADLGITDESLRTWVRKENESQALTERREAGGSPAEELVRLRAQNARLLAETEWQLEREILRRAAAYFARWVK